MNGANDLQAHRVASASQQQKSVQNNQVPVQVLDTISAQQTKLADSHSLDGTGACGPQTIGHRMQLQANLAPFLSSTATPTATDSNGKQLQSKRIFCFYDIQDELRPQDLNGCLCSHVVYSYVAVRKNLSFIAGKKGKFCNQYYLYVFNDLVCSIVAVFSSFLFFFCIRFCKYMQKHISTTLMHFSC